MLVGVGDDGAVLVPDAGRELVVVADTQIQSVHFPEDAATACIADDLRFRPADIGYRAVAINLSDIAAMAARPRWMTLALTLETVDEEWLREFANGLSTAASEYGVVLVGGDTTRGSQLSMTVSIIGDVERDAVLTRAGAEVGDDIYASGAIGDAAAALALRADSGVDQQALRQVHQRFARPIARVALGQALGTLASAAIDLSDGLYADCAKLLRSSGRGGVLNIDSIPVSEACSILLGNKAQERALGGGDDYELCFTARPGDATAIEEVAQHSGVPLTRVGAVTDGQQLICQQNGERFEYDAAGYLHFG